MTTLTVSQLNRYIKAVLEDERKLADLYIKGEISNFTHHFRSGHCYFTLKDETSAVRAVMFKSNAESLRFEPENGMAVLIRASIGVYERDGAYQLYVTDIQPDGAGALAVAFEQLKRKLAALGFFDEHHKKPIPSYPSRVGVVTSESGAAFADITNIISRRYPVCTVVLSPAQVQGENAAPMLVKALKTLDANGDCDVIIIGRGGGSAEDLWPFNNEKLARAVFEAKTPVVSAVGHETDYTICDFVADLRAPTPSAAAELVTPSMDEIFRSIRDLRLEFKGNSKKMLSQSESKLGELRRTRALSSPLGYVDKNQQRMDFFAQSLYNIKRTDLHRLERELSSRAAILESLSPFKVMSRGYCAVFFDDKAVMDVSRLKADSEILLKFREGYAKARVLEVVNEKESKL